MFASLETHFVAWAKTVGAEVADHVHSFLEYAKSREARVADAVAEVKAAGLKVIDSTGAEL